MQRGQAALNFGGVTERLKSLEMEIAELRQRIDVGRTQESASRRGGDVLRGVRASRRGRRFSLDGLIREHSYSTETVKGLFKAGGSNGLSPVGTLADFLEVDGQYEGVVDEFLRDELNYVVVKSWDAADAGMRMLESDVAGRATFLVHGEDDAHKSSYASQAAPAMQGVVALKDCVRVLNGFGTSLEGMLPKLKDGLYRAGCGVRRAGWQASTRAGFFLSPSGEAFHNATVTGGRVRAQGPLALKRELNEVQQKLDATEAELAQAEMEAARLERELRELTAALDAKTLALRDAERESANSGAALRQMWSRRRRASSGGCRSGRWRANATARRVRGSRSRLSRADRRPRRLKRSAKG